VALDGAPLVEALAGVRLRLVYDHEQTAAVMRVVSAAGARDVRHGLAGERPELTLSLPAAAEGAFAAALRDASRGVLRAERVGDVVLRQPAGR
jgi:hypothetical protein